MLEISKQVADELTAGNIVKFESREGFELIRIYCPHKNLAV